MNNFSAKVKSILSKYKLYLISLAILFVLFNLMLIINSDWPYGKNILLNSDSYQQICCLFEHIFQVFSGKSSLFYNPHIGSGVEIFSTLEYMFFNPFYLIVLCGGAKYYQNMFAIAVFFMLVFNLFVFLWFTNKHFKNISATYKVLFALAYTFSGYIVQNVSFITWLIFPALLLLLIDRFLKMINTGKLAGFIVFFTWTILNCYSIGATSVIVLFVSFSAYIFITKEKEERKQHFAKLFVAYFVTGLICLSVLFPSIIALFKTKRTNSLLANLIVIKNTGILAKIPSLFADGIIIVLAIIYLARCNKKEKLNKFFIFELCLCFIPILFDSCQKLLCGSIYYGFVARLYFFNEALIFILALKLINEKQNIEAQEKSSRVATSLFWAVSFTMFALVAVFSCLNFKNIGNLNKNQSASDYKLLLFDFVVFAMVGLIFVFAIILNRKKLFSNKMAKIAVCFALIFSTLFNFVGFAGGSKHIDTSRTQTKNILANNQISSGFKFFKTENKNKLSNIITDAKTDLIFSSLIQKNTVDFYSALGYATSSVSILDAGANLISDSLVGNNYYVSNYKQDRPYLELVDREGDFYLYKNILATNGVVALSSKFEFDYEKNYIENLEALREHLGIEGQLFSKLSLEQFSIKNATEDDTKIYSYSPSEDGILYCSASIWQLNEQYQENSNSAKYDYFIATNINKNYCYDLNYIKANQNYSFALCEIVKNKTLDDIHFIFLNYETAKQMCEKLIMCSKNINIETTKEGYKIKTELNDDAYIHVFRPDIFGMSYLINGEKISSQGMVIPIFQAKNGRIEIIASYKFPYLTAWIILFAISIILIIAMLVIYHFTKLRHVSGIITYAIYGINCCILAFFYFLGILLSFIAFRL